MKDLIIDIETARLRVIPEPPETILKRGMGNLVNEEKIAAKEKANIDSWFEKAALDYRKGQVIAIGIMQPDEDRPLIVTTEERTEVGLLQQAMEACRNADDLIGFNIWGFDLPFLLGRCWLTGVRWAPRFQLDELERPYPAKWCIDLMRRAAFGNTFEWAGWSLGYYAEALNLRTEPYGTGEDVAEWYAYGQWAEIRKHLERDLLMTRDLYNLIG